MDEPAQVTAVERLIAIESIKQLKARYFRTLDTKDWTGFRAVFADDARIGPIDSGRPLSEDRLVDEESADEFLVRVSSKMATVASAHRGHMPEIKILSATEACGVWAMEDLLVFPPGSPVGRLHGFGHYHETYVRGPDGWKIRSTRLTRIHVELD